MSVARMATDKPQRRVRAAQELEIPNSTGAKWITRTFHYQEMKATMTQFRRLKNQTLARIATRFPSVAQKFVDAYDAREVEDEIPWSAPVKPLDQSRLAVITTAGIHHRGQPPFDMNDKDGDPSYRELELETIFDDFQITHDYYNHVDADKDPNIVIPLDRLRELTQEGKIGSLAPTHYSFMGHIDGPHIQTLTERTALEVTERLAEEDVDLVLLTPA